MKWEQYRSVMERHAIKTDDMATEDAYFMSTHMPFSSLELYTGGYYDPRNMPAPARLMNEDEVFERLIWNPDDDHRMVVVRGTSGSGKSHLIRYLKGKFERSPSTVYDPNREQLVFLRRLNNSVRGAFSQLLDQGVVRDRELEEKLRKFVSSSDSKDEESFKTEILYAYIAAVRNDTSGRTYKAVKCRDIASYLSDSRVSDHLLREGGAISRCYNVITAPSDQILEDTTVFTVDDIDVSKIIRAVMRQGDPQASSMATSLKGDDEEIAKLTDYLNGFTGEVIQRCADISSENAETIFAQLRRDLKKQGKNLTIFIEDFTGFTGIDQELITALSYEHGGDYKDLCRVTSVIGITSEYYFKFQGNFKERVTHQIVVTDRAYGTDEFLVQMAARYLNAIYCDPAALTDWNASGAQIRDLPVSDFLPPCPWETATVEGKELTLYPFTRRALVSLYGSLGKKTPRMFLKNVIRAQMKEYLDGKMYGDGWYFPINSGNTEMANAPHSSAIDRLEDMPAEDRDRLKALFAIWGDGSAAGVREADGTIRFGGLHRAFLADIGLGAFGGIGAITDKSGGHTAAPAAKAAPAAAVSAQKPVAAEPPKPAHIDGATKNYLKFKSDITGWFSRGERLKYDQDYRDWLRSLIRGENKRCGAINWQDIGVPAYVAEGRLSDLSCYYIDDQSTPISAEKIIVYMDRSAESRDALMALNELHYAKGWDLESAVYYQQRLITWLERRKSQIIEKVTATREGEAPLPVLEWCLAIQYLKARILGQKVDTASPGAVIRSLFQGSGKGDKMTRVTREWNDLIQFTVNRKTDFESALKYLRQASATVMGSICGTTDHDGNFCYRADELLAAAEKLMAAGWDIEAELPREIPENHLLYNHAALLKALYPSIRKAVEAETKEAGAVIRELKGYIGPLTRKDLVEALAAVQELFKVFTHNGVMGNSDLRAKYEAPPVETAKTVLAHIAQIDDAATASPVAQLTAYSADPLNALHGFLKDIRAIAAWAEQEEARANKETSKVSGLVTDTGLTEAALASLGALYNQIENMEVDTDAAD